MRSSAFKFSMLLLVILLNGCATATQEHPYGPDYLEPPVQNVPQANVHAVVTP